MCNVYNTRRETAKKEKKLKQKNYRHMGKACTSPHTHTHTLKNRLILLNDLEFPTKGGKWSMNCEQPHDDPEAYLTEAVWLKPWH